MGTPTPARFEVVVQPHHKIDESPIPFSYTSVIELPSDRPTQQEISKHFSRLRTFARELFVVAKNPGFTVEDIDFDIVSVREV